MKMIKSTLSIIPKTLISLIALKLCFFKKKINSLGLSIMSSVSMSNWEIELVEHSSMILSLMLACCHCLVKWLQVILSAVNYFVLYSHLIIKVLILKISLNHFYHYNWKKQKNFCKEKLNSRHCLKWKY